MGLLEDAIREHLDLKRSRGADPAEIERLEQEALGPVRREPLTGNERTGFEYGAHANSPVEYHDSTAPHWQQDEDFGDHHEPVEVHDFEHQRRRGFLRRSRGHSSNDHETDIRVDSHEWPEDSDLVVEFEDAPVAHASPGDDESSVGGIQDSAQDWTETDHVADERFDEAAAGTGDLNELAEASDPSAPDYGPPTEVYRAIEEPETDMKAPAIHDSSEHFVPSPPPAGTQHPILDDLPAEFTEPGAVEIAGSDHGGRAGPSTAPGQTVEHATEPFEQSHAPVEPQARHDASTTAPRVPQVEADPAPPAAPPPLQFDQPPRRPSFTTEPPADGSDPNAPQRPTQDPYEPLRMFDVEDIADVGAAEDVLEETPEFLQDTPEHDRLWFEQRPPKDFDFDS